MRLGQGNGSSIQLICMQLIWNTYGAADVDLFVRIQSTQCPRWFSLSKEVGSLGLDVMAHSWPSDLLYAFPPFPIIWLVLSRIRVTSQPLLLIPPCWPNKLWFQLLHHLLTGPPAQLPIRPDLLTQLNGRLQHDQPQTLKLCVWPLGATPAFWSVRRGTGTLF